MKQKVLFICTGNACRSQMAEGLLRHMAGDKFEVYSAGTHPSIVHPISIRIMEELGIDISYHSSDHLADYINKRIDIVITVCDYAKELCPTFPGKVERIHWSIPDPFMGWSSEGQDLKPYQICRDLIKNRIDEFLKSH